ncbi:MAG: WD40/YVTN/BNR-like repeat-containing protein [Isosphaeraceae bacterium]
MAVAEASGFKIPEAQSRDHRETIWATIGGADGEVVRYNPLDSTGQTAYKLIQFGELYRSTNGGLNWTLIHAGVKTKFPFYAPFVIDPSFSNILYLGGLGDQVYVSNDSGSSWSTAGPPLGGGGSNYITALAVAPGADVDIYAGDSSGNVYVSTNQGSSWTNCNLSLSSANNVPDPVTSIAVDPAAASIAYVAVGGFDVVQGGGGGGVGQIFRTANFGSTWTNISREGSAGGMPNVPARSVVVAPGGLTVYLGTDVGVYRGTTINGTSPWTWDLYGNGLPSVEVTGLQLQTCGSQQFLAVATYGRGVWLTAVSGSPSGSGAIINNGTIELGVNPEGNLNVDGGTPSSGGTSTTLVGLRYMPTNDEITAEGTPAEGWGVADSTTGVTGYANRGGVAAGVSNVSVLSFTYTSSTAASVVQVGSTFKVTQDFRPSSNPNLYVITVTIQNISRSSVNIRYRRVVDWDIEPTAYDEYVSINGGSSQALSYDNDDGFTTANPLGAASSGWIQSLKTGNFTAAGPADIGALLDFSFPNVSAGNQVSFKLYYGGAATLSGVQSVLSSVAAQGYSLAQPGTANGLSQGTPNTFPSVLTRGRCIEHQYAYSRPHRGVRSCWLGARSPRARTM